MSTLPEIKSLIPEDLITYHIHKMGWYELPELICLEKEVLPVFGDRFCSYIDIGANIGTFTLFMANKSDCIFAFEPNKKSFNCLRVNVEDYKHVAAVNIGLSNRRGYYDVDTEKHNIGATMILKDTFSDTQVNVNQIPVMKLDDYWKYYTNNLQVDLIKLDIEGHELEALEGSIDLLTNQNPIIVCEIMNRHFQDETTCATEDFLKKLGYEYIYTMEQTKVGKILRHVTKIPKKIHPMVVFSRTKIK